MDYQREKENTNDKRVLSLRIINRFAAKKANFCTITATLVRISTFYFLACQVMAVSVQWASSVIRELHFCVLYCYLIITIIIIIIIKR